jgi:Zn-dependent membrane protease YugP
MFGIAIVVAFVPTSALEWAVMRYPAVARFVMDYYVVTVLGVIFFQLAVLFRLFTRDLPVWMDNAYLHESRADNLRSLRRVRSQPTQPS